MGFLIAQLHGKERVCGAVVGCERGGEVAVMGLKIAVHPFRALLCRAGGGGQSHGRREDHGAADSHAVGIGEAIDHALCTGGLTCQCDIVGVAAEQGDVFLHPFESGELVEQPAVGSRFAGFVVIAEDAEAVSHRHGHNMFFFSQFCQLGIGLLPAACEVVAAVDIDQHGQILAAQQRTVFHRCVDGQHLAVFRHPVQCVLRQDVVRLRCRLRDVEGALVRHFPFRYGGR